MAGKGRTAENAKCQLRASSHVLRRTYTFVRKVKTASEIRKADIMHAYYLQVVMIVKRVRKLSIIRVA